MPDKKAHLERAAANQTTIDYLVNEISDHSPWVATVAFYKSLHLVEAVFATENNHCPDHTVRTARMKPHQKLQHVYDFYRQLSEISEVARYMKGNKTDFQAYMPESRVRSEILGHFLRRLESAILKMLTPKKKAKSKKKRQHRRLPRRPS